MKFSFHPEAETEFDEAITFYEERQEGLGLDFSLEVYSTIQKITAHPTLWPILEGEVRRCLTHRFPYGILYSIETEAIFIVAVMHLHRDPDYWKLRQTS